MRYLLSSLICLITLNGCSQKTREKSEAELKNEPLKKDTVKTYPEECSKHYLFDKEVIDLELLKAIDLGGYVNDFKICSKYAHRFTNPISDTVYNDGYLYSVENDEDQRRYFLHISKNGKTIKSVKLPVDDPLPDVREYSFYLFPYKNDVIMYMEDMYTTHYYICKYNSEGEELMRKDIEHTYITHPEPTTNYMHRYLYFSELTSSQMIFTSHMAFADKFKTILLNMDNFTVNEYDKMAHGYILDENDAEFIGFVTSKKDYEAEKQPVNFEITMTNDAKYNFSIDYGSEACDFLLKDSLLYIGNYHPISTGSSLHCFDLRTGEMKWTADVLQVNASHSEYWNKVTLSMYKDKLIMQGDEAYGSYLQIFDAATGKRLAHFGNVFEEKK
jgi:hypothetical protein